MKRKPMMAIATSAFVLLVSLLVYLSTGSRLFTVLALVVLLLSLSKFYFPTVYRLSDRRIMIKTTTHTLYKEWSIFRSCWPDKNGILLSPFVEQSRLENFRGIFLLFDDNATEVTAFVKARINRPTADMLQPGIRP
ncbi:MAG: hypothetical protein AB1644_09625 [Candidatus Zixiibacteriota bacterium]